MPPRHPFFIGKNQVTFHDTIFLLLHALCVFLGASVVLVFLVSLVLFAAINGWTPTNFLRRRCTRFHLPRTLSFHSYRSPSVFLFPLLLLVFVFALICVQTLLYLFIKVYFCLWSLLVFIKIGVYKNFKWCWKREKAFCKIVVQEGACVDCGLGFFMSCLMSFW
jgi:hypothetical protein